MTKNVKLTQDYINNTLNPLLAKGLKFINGEHFIHVPDNQLTVEGESYKQDELIADPNNVPIYDIDGNLLRTQALQYYGCHCGENMTMPTAVADSLIGIVEEVT